MIFGCHFYGMGINWVNSTVNGWIKIMFVGSKMNNKRNDYIGHNDNNKVKLM